MYIHVYLFKQGACSSTWVRDFAIPIIFASIFSKHHLPMVLHKVNTEHI